MSGTTGTDAYAHYRRLCGDAPVLTPDELGAAVKAAGLRDELPDEAFWSTLFHRPDHRQFDRLAQGERDDWRAEARAEYDSWQAQGRADRAAWQETTGEGGRPRWWEAQGRDTR